MREPVGYIEDKRVDWTAVQAYLAVSESLNHWSNFGPVNRMLEDRIREVMGVPEDKCVVSASSGTSALFALVDLHEYLSGRRLSWAVSSFGFHCTNQGPLSGSHVVDCDEDGLINLEEVPGHCDGLVVTNPFGTREDMREYAEYSRDEGKTLIIDSAMAMDAAPVVSDAIVSFHQTKPWGMGEGGCAIADREHEKRLRSILNFGLMSPVGGKGGNGKLSDIGAAFILDRLDRIVDCRESYRRQHDRIASVARNRGWRVLERGKGTPACVPLAWEGPVDVPDNPLVVLRKYYKPLRETPVASGLYSRLLNFPCHSGLSRLSPDEIGKVLELAE